MPFFPEEKEECILGVPLSQSNSHHKKTAVPVIFCELFLESTGTQNLTNKLPHNQSVILVIHRVQPSCSLLTCSKHTLYS